MDVLLKGTAGIQPTEARGNNRSVMPLDVLGRTRATLIETASFSLLGRRVRATPPASIVLGIDRCNCRSSTRNS